MKVFYLKSQKVSLVAFLLYLLFSINSYCQTKQRLEPENYHLWSTVYPNEISSNGEWVSYNVKYEFGQDTLFLKNTETGLKYLFPGGISGKFNFNNRWFACLSPEKKIKLLDLSSGDIKNIKGAISFEFSERGDFMAFLKPPDTGKEGNNLVIKDLQKDHLVNIEGVVHYKFNPKKDLLACTIKGENKNSVKIIDLCSNFLKETVIASHESGKFKNLVWHEQGNSLIFLQEFEDSIAREKNNKVHFFSFHSSFTKTSVFDPLEVKGFPNGVIVSVNFGYPLMISQDESRVFFSIRRREINKGSSDKNPVEIWHSKDKLIYPRQKIIGTWPEMKRMAVWWPNKKKFLQISSKDLPEAILTGNQKYALTFNPKKYKPQFEKKNGDVDFYITNLQTQKRNLFLRKQTKSLHYTLISPCGNFISYFKSGDWWIYEIATGEKRNLTEILPYSVQNSEYDMPGLPPPYGAPGWIKNDEFLIVYDQYDIWLLSPDGKFRKRITDGRKNKEIFRIPKAIYKKSLKNFFPRFYGITVDMKNGIALKSIEEDMDSKFHIYKPDGTISPLSNENLKADIIVKAKNENSFVFREQRFDMPPRLVFSGENKKNPKILYESNPQQKNYYWGKAELLSYRCGGKKDVKGILFYPAEFERGEKYPMVVRIYEKQSQNLHEYVNPSNFSFTGFNPTNYTLNGYAVLYPDIHYKLNKVGFSAKDCVIAAVDAAVAKGVVKEEKIGLIGHSFGGYETSFIITQTDKFAAAVAGAAITNFQRYYFSIESDYGYIPRFWRFESDQQRFKGPYYDFKQDYLKNSPVQHLKDVETPLLSWTGKEDRHVHWFQSIEMYLAFRRLKKQHVMLVYPEENHVLSNPKYQQDLSNKVNQWFDYYLKKEEPEKWILKQNN